MGQLLNNRTCRKCGVELIVGNNWSKGASLKPDCICRSCKTAASRKWVEANPERAAATKAAWTEANRDRLKQLSRNWQEQNREKTRVSSAKWRDANPEKRKATTARYRAANPDRELINAATQTDVSQATPTSTASTSRREIASRRARPSPLPATPGTRPARTFTSRLATHRTDASTLAPSSASQHKTRRLIPRLRPWKWRMQTPRHNGALAHPARRS